MDVSIHAPVKGATDIPFPRSAWLLCFNPRTREGCDKKSPVLSQAENCFNPRTREGCDR